MACRFRYNRNKWRCLIWYVSFAGSLALTPVDSAVAWDYRLSKKFIPKVQLQQLRYSFCVLKCGSFTIPLDSGFLAAFLPSLLGLMTIKINEFTIFVVKIKINYLKREKRTHHKRKNTLRWRYNEGRNYTRSIWWRNPNSCEFRLPSEFNQFVRFGARVGLRGWMWFHTTKCKIPFFRNFVRWTRTSVRSS